MQRKKRIQIIKTVSTIVFSIIVLLLLALGVKNSDFGNIKKYDNSGKSPRDMITKSISSSGMQVSITNDEIANLGDFIFNIAGDRKLIANISLKYKSNTKDNSWFGSKDDIKKEILKKSVILRDSTINTMLGNPIATANSEKMRKELSDTLNKNLSTGKVIEVYFNKFIIQ
ncbi:MAG: flagellar basal body-associated FliL family protein [Sulfurimonas sp.]|nr:flagellar basal body-associated FliL family protein [Sulfurimonas sp.]